MVSRLLFVAFLFMISLRVMSRIKANMRLLIHIKKLKRKGMSTCHTKRPGIAS
ncbi:hypothetical protein HanPSC8_Chr11g0461761 [Helianthus annuus]|nr:hypothetical protein HanPSC8_Chr11g0461761 [Helianthus annuus]